MERITLLLSKNLLQCTQMMQSVNISQVVNEWFRMSVCITLFAFQV